MIFLTDSMFGKVTRLLRIFGYDTIYAEEVKPSAPDTMLLDYAIKNDRIIITRDLPFHERDGERVVYCNEEDPYLVLKYLKNKFDLKYQFNMKQARCSVCNGTLDIVSKEKITNQVKSDTLKYFDEFFQCNNQKCKKIYWKGSHIEKVLSRLDEALSS